MRQPGGVGRLLLGLLLLAIAPVDASPLELDGSKAVRQLGDSAAMLADPSDAMTLAEARTALSDGAFEPIGIAHFDAGYSITPYWIAIPVTNTSARETAHLLSTNIPYVPELSVTLLRQDGSTEPLLDKTIETPWRRDQYVGQSVISAQFPLQPGETATLLARFQPYGIGVLPLSIETPITAFEQAASGKLILFAFYSFALTSLVLLFLFVLALRHPGGLNFLALFACGLVMMAQLDGLLNQWVWPNGPGWNKVASFPMLLALCSAGFMTAAFMLRTGGAPRLAQAGHRLALACFAPLLLTPVIDVAWLILIGFVFMMMAMALLTYAVINWAQLLPGKTQIALAVGVAIFLALGFIFVDILSGRGHLSAQNLTLVKVLYTLISLIIVMSYATQVAALNREHATAVERQLDLAQNEARISADLLASERRYAHARDLVARQRHRLANASHDFRQPLASLRLTLDSIARRSDGSVDENLTRAFDYLDDLVSNHLVESHDEEEEAPEAHADVETIETALITRTVVEMFTEEATAKGLRLRHVQSCALIRVPPMPVMRIVGNLVSNAIKYTEYGGVLVGSRQRGDRVAIEIVDTGPGMDHAELDALSARYQKGVTSNGEGLGLAICYELAALHGLDLAARSRRGRGTGFTLYVPRGDSRQ